MIIPAKVEEKIRYLIRKFPHTEWSGVLFIRHTGTFEDNNLVITCEDLYPMDLGSSGWTEFKMTEDVTAYMAENIELFECDLALCHSHHSLGAFFSGQDIKTLQIEGNDTNCFVSLIVDTRGTYQAAITRKLTQNIESTIKHYSHSYEFFGEGTVQESGNPVEETKVTENTIIEYFMLDIQKEEVTNPLEYLDSRFEEIEEKKKVNVVKPYASASTMTAHWEDEKDDTFPSFRDYLNRNRKNEQKETYLFSNEEMKDLEAEPNIEVDPTVVHDCVAKMIACSLIIDTTRFNLEQWISRFMKEKYDTIFPTLESFMSWSEFAVEWMLEYASMDTNEDSYEYQMALAHAMYDELLNYSGQNDYIDKYLEVISRWFE